jgi:hypothetical protein
MDCSFHKATLHQADFSGARLQSSRVRLSSSLFRGFVVAHPMSFYNARLQDADFRQETWGWEETNWWEADLSPGSLYTFDPEEAAGRTRASFALLYEKYKGTLAEQVGRIHPSVQELRAAFTSANGPTWTSTMS